MAEHKYAIREHLMAAGVLDHASFSFSPPLDLWSGANNQNILWEGDDLNSKEFINVEFTTPSYVATMGLKIKAGRDFYPEPIVDSSSALIDESLAALMGKAGKPGSRITLLQGNLRTPITIVGIVNNFVHNDMYGKPGPVLFLTNP